MNTFFARYAWVLGVCCLGLFLLWQFVALILTPVPWHFKPGPPVPLQFAIAGTTYDSNCYTPSCARFTHFDTFLTTDELEDFYRRELERRGWRYHCTARVDLPPCLLTERHPAKAGPGMAQSSLRCDEGADRPACEVYNRADRILVFDQGRAGSSSRSAIEILIDLPDSSGERFVRIGELPGVADRHTASANETSGSVGNRLVGDWEGIEADGVSLLLRFHERGVVSLARGSAHHGGTLRRGNYALNGGATKLRLQITQIDPIEAGANCLYYPAFLQEACRSPKGVDLTLALRLDGDTLALTQADGRTLSLRRQGE